MPKVSTGDWTLSGVSIAVEQDSEDYPAVRMGQLGVLDSNKTVLHFGGTTAMERELTFVSFSGYENDILPLVGSGYHSLSNDFGSQGNYLITKLAPTRLQDLKCYTGMPHVYRCKATLRKQSLTTEPTDRMLFGAKTTGLYYCSDIAYDGTVPVWTLLDGEYGVAALSVNEDDPLSVQVILATTDGGVFARGTEVSDSYISILTKAEALVLAQAIHADMNDVEILNVAYNTYYENRVHVLFRAWRGITYGGIYVATTDNYGQGTWVCTHTEYYGSANRTDDTGGSIVVSPVATGTYAKGYTVWAAAEFGNGDSHTISTDGGIAFATGVDTGTGSYVANVYADRHAQGKLWTQGGGVTSIGALTNHNLASYAAIGPLLTAPVTNPITSAVFQDPNDADNIAVAYVTLKYSTNAAVDFTSAVSPATENLARIGGHSWAKIAVAIGTDGIEGDAWAVIWGTPDLGTTFYSLAGTDPENNAAGTSIPYNCGGAGSKCIACWNA